VILYGRNAVREALRGPREVRDVWATERAAREPWLREVGPRVVEAAEIEARCGSDGHQGVCAHAAPYRYADAAALLAAPAPGEAGDGGAGSGAGDGGAGDGGADPLVLALDEVTDPQNLGAVCRSAEAAGATGVVLPRHRSAEVTPAVCKASAGAVEHLAVAQVRNLADFLVEAKEAGCWCYGADAGATVSYDAPDFSGGVVVVMGSEGRGLRPRVAAACDELLAIPQRGKVDSLNVSVAAAVLLYEIVQQRSRS
jgi:23S rRNA (guanosine2251-2'-O)-methyltransferase